MRDRSVEEPCLEIRSKAALAPLGDVCWRRKEALSVSNFNLIGIFDLAIRTARDHFEEIALRTDRRRRHLPYLCTGHLRLSHGVMHAIDLDLKLFRSLP